MKSPQCGAGFQSLIFPYLSFTYPNGTPPYLIAAQSMTVARRPPVLCIICWAAGMWLMFWIYNSQRHSLRALRHKAGAFGGGGLLSPGGIRKPAYYAYYFLNKLENTLLFKNENMIITSGSDGHIVICSHNYKHYNFKYYFYG